MSFSLAAHTFGSAFPQRNFPPGGSVLPQCRRRSRLSQPPLEFWVRARDPAFTSQVCGHRAWSYKPVMKEAGFRERTLGRVVVCTFLQGSSGEGSSLLWAAGCFYRYFWWSCSVVRSGSILAWFSGPSGDTLGCPSENSFPVQPSRSTSILLATRSLVHYCGSFQFLNP